MKIGIGVTTYNRRSHIELFKKQFNKFPIKHDTLVYCIQDDDGAFVLSEYSLEKDETNWQQGFSGIRERVGVAARKNECLMVLKDCDYIVLFDDDCFPLKDGWVDYLIECSKASGEKHFLYLKETSHIKKIKHGEIVSYYNNCGGCMMFLTKEVIEKVGGYNKDYGLYGFEHAGYSIRIHNAGLTSMRYPSPSRIGEYIYSLDYDNYIDWGIEHKPSLTLSELKNVEGQIEIFKKDIETIYQPL